MKNCLHTFTKWIFCLLALVAINDLAAQNVRDGFCDYAIDASCGVAITNQTNKGGANVIWDYQCNDYTFSGPEKVYKFTTTSAGIVQIDLSINEANTDLDILLLSDNCTTPTCLAQAITSNANGKTEQLIYNNAPAGTYYVVVDSEKDVGTYDLLITCTSSSGCNLEYTATPNHISCGAAKGSIDIAIAWGKAPFTIAWDNADNSIWNTYTTSDKNYKIDNLPAGVYTVKVTDAMGCELMRNNIALTNSGNTLAATFSTTPAPCGSSFGWINVDVANSSPPYWVTVTGPRNGTVQATSDNIVIKDMPPGNYEVTVEKGGCTKEGWVTVGSTANLDFVAEVTNASCGGKGSFWITIDGGSPTYTLEWWHKDGTSDWVQTSAKSFPLTELKAGEYTIKITDKNGCAKTKKVTLGGGTLDFALESNAATCGSKGSVWVTITSGTKNFVVEWTGPTNGWKNTDKNSFALDDLVAGNYEINIKDAKGCQNTKWITVNDGGGNLDFELESNSATCSEKGAIWVTIKNGTPNYTVEWWGPNTSKWATTAVKSFQLKDLGVGDYTVKITDSKGCSNTKTVKINSSGNGLDISLETLGVKCGALASLWIDIKNGTSKYGVDVTGPGVNKWFEATSSKIQVTDLPVGNFTVKVTDANGCTGTKTIVIEDKGGNLDVALETTAASCGGKGSSWVTIKNGSPKFIIELWGPNNATFWAETNSASFRLSDLNPGDYTVKFTDKNGCAVTKTFKIGGGSSNMSMALEVNNAGCEDNGRIWVTINGGTAGYKLTWAGPTAGEANMANNGYQINNLKAGDYTLTVKDHYGCTNSKTVTVYGAGNNLTLALESNPATCSQNGFLWADVKNGEGPYQVSWTGAAAGSMNVNNAGFQVSDLPAGAYWVSVKDKNGCSVTKEVTVVNGGSNLGVDLEVNNGSCGSNGYVWVTIQNGDGPYHIVWTGPKNGEVNSGSNGYQISDLPRGWYKVTVKDKHGCKIIKDIEVLGGGVYTVTTQQTNATCGKNGEVWVNMNGGVAPFNLNLTGPVIGNTSTNGYNYHFPSVPPGTYTLSLQDATGCVVSKQLTITNSGGNLNASVEATNAVCGQGGAAWVTINGNTAPYTINWTGPITGSYISSDPGYQIQNLSAGDYTISVKDNYGCYTNKSITISNTGNSLNLSLEATNASCGQKGAIWTTITGGKADYTISWTGPSAGSMQTSTTGNRIPDLGAGTYAVKVTDKNNCSTSASIIIGSNVQDFTISTESTNATCEQKGWAWITMNGGSPNYNISWSGPINGSISTSQSGYRLDNLVAGTYAVTVKEYSGCEDTKTIIIYDNGSNIALNLEGTSATCDSKGSIWATIGGGTAGYSYSWTGPSTGSISTSQTGYSIGNLSAGTYTVTVRDSKGCETAKSVTVGNNVQNFSISTESTNATCGQKGWAWITMNGGSSNYTISWSGPLTNSVTTSESGYRLDNLVAGTYAVTVKDANGCEDTKTIIIYDNGSDIALNLEGTSATCDSKGSIWATINGGTAGYSYSWTGPSTGSISTSQTGYSIGNLSAGTYTVTVRDSKGCETVKSVTVGNNVQNFSISTESTNATCGQKGWAWITMNGGSANYTISWSGPLTNSVTTSESGYRLDNLVAGTYVVIVKDANGCEDTKTIIIYDNGSDIALNLEGTSATCDSKGSIWATITGGTAGYSYSWTGPSTGSISTTQTGYSIGNLSAGTYTVTVRDSKGCETVKSVTVGNNVQNFSISTESTNATCGQKGWAWITMNGGSSNYTISWSGPLTNSVTTSESGYRLDNLVAGTYAVTVKDANGCEDTKTIIIYDNGSDIALNLEETSASCNSKGSIWATISGGTAGYSYSWTGPSTGSMSTSQTGYRIENLSAGTYTVTVRDSKGCETVKSVTVGNNVQNFSISTESTNATCGQKGWAYITMNGGSPAYNITWSGPTSGSANVSTTGYRLDNLIVGTYTVTVKDANGCEDTKTIIIYDNGSDIALNLEGTSATCDSKGSIWATISGGTAGYSYSWVGTGSGSGTGSVSTSETGYKIENLSAGTYTVTVRDSKGCETTKSVTVGNNVQNFSISTESTNATCGQKGWAWITMNGGSPSYAISWSGALTGSASTSESGYRLDDLVVGTYAITVKDANGCEDTKTVIITDNGSDITLVLEATNGSCDSKGSIWATITGGTAGYSYSWTGPVTGSVSTSETGYRIESLPAGDYTVTVRDSKGCETNHSVTVQSIGGNLTVNLSTTTSVACAHDGTTYVSIGGGKAPYTINYVGPTTATVTANANDYQLNLSPGDYTVFVKDSNGCEGSQKIKIYDNGSDLAINLTSTSASCTDKGMLLVNISGGISNYQINWSGNGINETITTENKSFALTDLTAGTYEVKVSDGIGCAVSKSVTINNAGSNLGLQLVPKNGTCGQAGAIDVSISGGAANYTISWSGSTAGSEVSSASSYQISGLGIGNYTVTVKDGNGCEIKETVSITAGSAVDFNLTGTNAECNKNGNIVVDLIAGTPNYAISWTGPSSGSQTVSANVYKIDGLIAGTYNVTVKDANNCESTKSIVIGASGSSLGLTLTNTNASCGANGNITATVVYGEGEYTYSWTGPVTGSEKSSASTYAIWDLPAGSYTVSVIDKNGCSISKIIEVNTAANELALNVVGKNASCGQASSIQVTIANGVPNFKIEWSGANTGTFNTSANSYTITNVTNGETVVRVTDASGCSKAQAVVIDASPNDVNFTYQSKEASCNNKGAIWLTISDGTAPYNIAWTGLSSGASVSADEAVQITDLDAGVYSVTVSDKSNCMITQTIEVKNVGGGTATNFAYKASAVTCNVSGSVLVTMISGVAPYTVAWSGPTNGSRTASTADIKIENLVVGDYQVTVASANGCGALTQSITIEDKRVVLGISGTVTNGVCGGKGTVGLSWSGDRDPYTISWTGTSVGSIVTNDRFQTITDLKNGSYTFTVTGFDGCTGQYQATINNAGNSANADFTYGISARKLTFSNLSSTGTYAWDFGDGQTSTEINPIHTYEKNGTYTICLTVTNDCGTKEKCQTVTINAVNSSNGTSSAKVVLADKSGPKGTVLQLPVRVENCGRISTLSGTINLGNANVAQINGLSPNAISPVYNDANHSFSYLASGSGMDITGETILFYINVQLIGGVGESSTVDLSSLPVALELTCTEDGFGPPITPEVGSGRVSVATNASILTEVGGSVLTYWGDGVADAMVTIRSTDHEMNPMTTLDGDYAAEAVPMGYEYEFKPSKTTNPANGLSTFGLFLTQKYILGYQPEQIQSPYQVVAMDANCSGSLTTFDLFAMQQMLVGNLTEFPGCESWVFVDADHEFPTEFTNTNVFPYPNSHTMMLEEVDAVADFIGVKVGDVLGRALPNDNTLFTQATDRNRKVMPLQVSAEKVAAGEILEVQFEAQAFTEMVSFQLGLDFDPTMLELVEFVPNAENELSSALSGVTRNHLKVSWYDPAGKGTALVENENLFTLKFVAKQKIIDVMELFTINNRTFVSELHQQSNEAYRFKLINKSSANSTFKVHQNTPNPFMDATTITIEMPTALDAAIVLHDQFGRTIQTIQQPLKAGVNKVNLNRNQLSAGIYYYTVKAGDFAATKRMMIIE